VYCRQLCEIVVTVRDCPGVGLQGKFVGAPDGFGRNVDPSVHISKVKFAGDL
jgi:hypothetical protein